MTLLMSLAPPATTSVVTTTRLSDRFNGTAATALSSHTPDVGGPWTVNLGSSTLDGSGAANFGTTPSAATAPCGVADVTITMVFTETAQQRVVFRLTDAANYWYAEYNNSSEFLRINEVNAGVPTVRATATTFAIGGDRTMIVVVSGTTVSARLADDPGQVASYSTMATGAGKTAHGIGGVIGSVIKDLVITG